MACTPGLPEGRRRVLLAGVRDFLEQDTEPTAAQLAGLADPGFLQRQGTTEELLCRQLVETPLAPGGGRQGGALCVDLAVEAGVRAGAAAAPPAALVLRPS